jgi:hypothetical protein
VFSSCEVPRPILGPGPDGADIPVYLAHDVGGTVEGCVGHVGAQCYSGPTVGAALPPAPQAAGLDLLVPCLEHSRVPIRCDHLATPVPLPDPLFATEPVGKWA